MLELLNISKSFNQKLAINDVSFTVKSGEIFGLLGPNGAGKTTLIRIINKIIVQDTGVVKYKGQPMLEKDLAFFGYLPEERGLYKTMTVLEHAVFLGRLRGLTKNDALTQLNYWLEKFDITQWKNKRIEELSKGMAQKIQFICTVLHQPDFIILDEPFSGFDPLNVELIQNEISEFKKQGKSILISTHNMGSVDELCDRVVLINKSEKVLEGSVDQIRSQFKNGSYAIRFKGSMIALVNTLWTGFELVDKEVLSDNEFIAYIKMRQENNFQDLLKTLLGNVEIISAWEVLPNMQQIFIDSVTKEIQA